MVNGFAFETESRAKQRDAMRRAGQERLALRSVGGVGGRHRPTVTVNPPAARWLVPRLVGFLSAPRRRPTEWI